MDDPCEKCLCEFCEKTDACGCGSCDNSNSQKLHCEDYEGIYDIEDEDAIIAIDLLRRFCKCKKYCKRCAIKNWCDDERQNKLPDEWRT